MKRFLAGFLALTLLAAIPAPLALAAEDTGCSVCDGVESDNHLVKTGSQFTRGLANVALSWLEMFRQPKEEIDNSGNVLVGVGEGVGHTFLRLAKGLGEMIVSPLPHAKDDSRIATNCPICMGRRA